MTKDNLIEKYHIGIHDREDFKKDINDFALHIAEQAVEGKEFEVKRIKNHSGDSHLVVITEPAIEDIQMGTVLIIPYAEGFKDPHKVLLKVDKEGKPMTLNEYFAIVLKYIHE